MAPASKLVNTLDNRLFFFKNRSTFQVLVSASPEIKNESLKEQLPYPSGKMTAPKRMRPPRVRNDHWAAMAVVSCPAQECAQHIADEFLRYRAIRETLPLTEEQKAMTVLKRRRVAMRRSVPESVADLADIVRRSNLKDGITFYWGDPSDKLWAKQWPETARHARLERRHGSPQSGILLDKEGNVKTESSADAAEISK